MNKIRTVIRVHIDIANQMFCNALENKMQHLDSLVKTDNGDEEINALLAEGYHIIDVQLFSDIKRGLIYDIFYLQYSDEENNNMLNMGGPDGYDMEMTEPSSDEDEFQSHIRKLFVGREQ